MPLFRKKTAAAESTTEPLRVSVNLNARVQPVHRGEVYEDPLQAALDQYAAGSRIDGGGSSFDPTDGVSSCDIELALVGDRDEVLGLVVRALEHFGAPVGSSYRVGDEDPVPFGRTLGVSLSLDGTTLPDEVYANNDVNELVGALLAELGEAAELQSWWEGPERTSFFFYGDDPALIRGVLESAAGRFPLAEKSLVADIT
jgi:hypothetical protein